MCNVANATAHADCNQSCGDDSHARCSPPFTTAGLAGWGGQGQGAKHAMVELGEQSAALAARYVYWVCDHLCAALQGTAGVATG